MGIVWERGPTIGVSCKIPLFLVHLLKLLAEGVIRMLRVYLGGIRSHQPSQGHGGSS